jgi:Zn-dependent protease with chaperone function
VKFFEEQASARRQTFWLIVVFGILVILFSLMNSVLVGLSFKNWTEHFWPVFGMTFFFFAASAWIHYLNTRYGPRVAELLGGRPLILNTKNFLESRCYHIVEEMAIAASVPIPHIYILDHEKEINAFVAGIDSHSLVLGVTAGALEKLNRDELQAVIGHEFSHILNEDMALNVKLAGMVSGFFIFIRIGKYLSDRSHHFGRHSSLNILGLGFFVVGWIGWICGRVLQAMICRRREFLADASSAQFTRHPESLARALGKINSSPVSPFRSSYSPELSHFFFSADGTQGLWNDIIPTHPPTIDRIRKLMPSVPPEEFLKRLEAEVALADDSDASNSKMKGGPRTMGWTEPSSDPKVALLRVLLSSQQETVRVQVLEYLRQTNPSQDQEVLSIGFDNEVTRFNLFKSALGKIRHSSQSEKDGLLNSMQSLFELDQMIDFEEGLYYLLALQNLAPVPAAQKKVNDLRLLEPIFARWVPWILGTNDPSVIERVNHIVLGRFDIHPHSKVPLKESVQRISLKDLPQDLVFFSSLDGNLKNKLALIFRDLILHQNCQPQKKQYEILLLAWLLQVPSKHII